MRKILSAVAVSILLLLSTTLQAHPRIWVNNSDKDRILENIERYQWAKDLKEDLEARVDPWSERHIDNPGFLLSRLPRTWGNQKNYTDADLTQKNDNHPYLVSGDAPIPTFHRSDDYIPRTAGGRAYVFKGIESVPPYNTNPYFGLNLQVEGTSRTEYLAYPARILRNIYTEVSMLGVDSAVLYYLTGKPEYAQLSADILHAFVEPLVYMNSVEDVRDHAEGFFITNFLRDARITAPAFPLMYDLIHPFLKQRGITVYDAVSKSRKPFNDNAAQDSFKKIAQWVLAKGITNSNWSILEGSAVLFNIIVIDDDRERMRLFDIFYRQGTNRHDAFTWSLNNFTTENLWPESLGYSFDVNRRILTMMEIIDRNKDILDVDVFNGRTQMLDGPFMYENLEYPTREVPRFGDSKRESFPVEKNYAVVAAIARRKGLNNYYEKSSDALASQYQRLGQYAPKIESASLGYHSPLQLLWGEDVNLDKTIALPSKDRSIYISHAGIALQRNYETSNTIDYGLMYYMGGASYVHTHASGLDLELYGAGKVMGPDFGSYIYGRDLHEHYAFNPASHNTVIVNGQAQRGEGGWSNIMADAELLAIEPKPLKQALTDNFSFSCQALDDHINDADHQRCVVMVRLDNENGYYLDVFRSSAKGQNQFSDYLYHNLGDQTAVNVFGGNSLPLENTPNRYKNDLGDEFKSPGWHFFENTKTSSATDKTVHVQFQLEALDRAMNAYVLGGDGAREISIAEGPNTLDAGDGYQNKPVQVMTIRRQGEAWKRPYVVLYEPQMAVTSHIQSVRLLKHNGEVVGVEVTSKVDDTETKDTIIVHDSRNKTYSSNTDASLAFTGRLAIVRERANQGKIQTELYIGDGERLALNDTVLTASADRTAYQRVEGSNVPEELKLKGFDFAVDEKEMIEITRPVDIAFGAEGNYLYRTNQRGSVLCENALCFRDPAQGIKKRCFIRESKTSYGERLIGVPGSLEVEHYDYGGQGVSYSDSSPELNKGALVAGYRAAEGVDLTLGNGGVVLSWIGAGEWVEYSIYVHDGADYNIKMIAASEAGGGQVDIELNGQFISQFIVPPTSSSDNYQPITNVVSLSQGAHRLRLNFVSGGFNLDKIIFTKMP